MSVQKTGGILFRREHLLNVYNVVGLCYVLYIFFHLILWIKYFCTQFIDKNIEA